MWPPVTRKAKRNAKKAAKAHSRAYSPYPTIADLKGSGLGFVLAPWEINRTLPNGPPYLKPFDPGYYQRGEMDLYYDTQLGAIPTDAELGPNECYTPVQSGWINAKEGFVPPPWVPPHGWRPVPAQYGPPTSLDGAQLSDFGGALEELVKHQKKMFYISLISTTAIVAVAIANVWKATRG